MRFPPRSRSIVTFAAATTTSTTVVIATVGQNRSLHSRHRIALHRASSPVASARSKSTHHPTHQPSTTKSPVLPKPFQIASTLLSEENGAPPTAHPPPPPHQGPPRLVRYQAEPHAPLPPHPLSRYPSSFAHASYPDPVSYRAHLSNRRAPASLFGLFPSTSATAASSVQASSDPFAYNEKASAQVKEIGEPSGTMAASTSSIVDAAKAGEAELHQRKKTAASTVEPNAAAKTNAALGHHHHHHGHGHGHGHHHDHGSAEEADALLAALKGKGDRGSNITLAGLVSNVGLCGAKGVAGVYLNSAALLADAAHSLSDMFADLVTLFCWKMSQKPPSASHPLGYGKYETMGSLGVSLVLVAGAVGIGFHSYGLLLEALQPTLQHAPAALQAFGHFTGSLANAGGLLHDHHDHGVASGDAGAGGLLDPNAMWFALLSIVVKEWLYHATLKIAREENSSVLEANALHHRSDSLSSAVTFLAIGGSYLGFPVLDPLGGLLVAGLIGKQGADLLIAALAELSDRGVDPETLQRFDAAIVDVQKRLPMLLGWKDLRAVKSGVSVFADVTLQLPNDATLLQAGEVEMAVRDAIKSSIKGVKEVRVRLVTVDAVN
ncbi:related to MMT1-Mitochondrial iron transport protein [Sporisorium reilianum f. sp. reilianum]|uniref:Related to MMT1-Mitochondrial iron transport protein n=1 Tax=Sporisorium reilianum f. sp. reilianum TaxID=72559 RepID=A0A2N8U7B5_9BASI|nr:related to MMT1-Mitochondrial iron transport protein [Sporisorium reilianum f. sp. reilianum]